MSEAGSQPSPKYERVVFGPTEDGGHDFYCVWADSQEELDAKLARLNEHFREIEAETKGDESDQ